MNPTTSAPCARDLVEMQFHEGNHLCPICEVRAETANCSHGLPPWHD